ncbi:MAG: TlpA family protein disulfide reductase [Clostridiales bacterium]|jgi:thiol-disulfide isomerase/thioredoxin|nr:TlpA family protein disulfide reductase [Clostridiales bacterium]
MKQVKKIIAAVLCAGMMISGSPALAAASEAAVPKKMPLSVDGKKTTMDAYNIGGSNYFKLRDLARLLSGTPKQFDVNWNESASRADLITGTPYTLTSADSTPALSDSAAANLALQTLYVDAKAYQITAANIQDLNYFKIRDFASLVNMPIDYQQSTDTILLSTGAATVTPDPKKTSYTATDYGFGQIGSFQTTDMNGQSVSNEIFKEKQITFINYWATWCGPCRTELPDFQGMHDKYQDRVKFITIVDDGKEAKSSADKLISSYLTDYLNLLPVPDLVRPIQTGAVPTSVIVDSGGYLVLDKIVGSYGRYDTFLDKALKIVAP